MNVIGVDVGTTSVRLAIVSFSGDKAQKARVLASHEKAIKHHQKGEKFEQNSQEIWQAVCECCRACLGSSKVRTSSIRGIAFSATCSLVIHKDNDHNEDHQTDTEDNDIIMWMDHRAVGEAKRVTDSKFDVLRQFGGVCSPEMSLAKLLWLKHNEPSRFASSTFFELPDWLTFKCIGGKPSDSARSLCSVACKWGYNVDKAKHCDLLSLILPEVNNTPVLGPGTVAGLLCRKSAEQLGIYDQQDKENSLQLIAVATSLIDAHSGALAMLVPLKQVQLKQDVSGMASFCSLAGTSSCHMFLSREPVSVRGIWGPYRDVILQGHYLLEAGQTLTGKLIEICIQSHEDGKRRLASGEQLYSIIQDLNNAIGSAPAESILHVLPTYHGNRSPLANPRLLGGIYGLSADNKSLLEHYVATIESLVYELRHIVDVMQCKLECVLVSGGLMKNNLYMQTIADVLRCRVIKMSLSHVDLMVMGSSLLARHASLGLTGSSQPDRKLAPIDEQSLQEVEFEQIQLEVLEPRASVRSYHEKKYECYKEFVKLAERVDTIMHSNGI